MRLGIGARERLALVGAALLQFVWSFQGLAGAWTRGHNGFGGAAYHQAARNGLRFDLLWPWQWSTELRPPAPAELYVHHPPALHWFDMLSLASFGDHNWAIRLVPALHSFAAIFVLWALLRRFWGREHAILGVWIYALLPINAIYSNMPVPSPGFMLWGMAFAYAYLAYQQAERCPGLCPPPLPPPCPAQAVESGPGSGAPSGEGSGSSWPAFAALLLTFALAALWDWPAYYLAFGLALHWLATLLARARAGARLGGALWRWLLFCAWVLFLFGGHFYAVHLLLGDIGHLHETFSARQQVPEGAFARHLLRVPPLMFTLPVLLLGALWLLFWPLRRRKRGPCPRDAIPLAFAFGGLLHFFLFKWSAIVHSYWAWNLNPYMAIALPGVLLGAIGWLRGRWPEGRRAPILAVSLIALALLPLAHRIVFLVPRARHAGGSMWFVSKARTDTPERYDAGRPELLFAEKVKEWTDRRTGVWIHSSFDRFRTEQRVEVTMDRVWRRSRTIRPRALQGAGLDGWVVIGVVDTVPRPEVLAMARQHPYRQVGNFFMLDLRREGSEVRIYELEEQPMSLDWAFLHTPFEAPLAPRRDETAEASMRRALER